MKTKIEAALLTLVSLSLLVLLFAFYPHFMTYALLGIAAIVIFIAVYVMIYNFIKNR